VGCMNAADGIYEGKTVDGFRVIVSEYAFFRELEELEQQRVPYEEAARCLLDPAYWQARPEKCLSVAKAAPRRELSSSLSDQGRQQGRER